MKVIVILLLFLICNFKDINPSVLAPPFYKVIKPDNNLSFSRELAQNLHSGKYGLPDEIIIQQDSTILFQKSSEYPFPGSVQSVTKSVLSILLGIAVKQGKIKSISEKLINFFPEYKKNTAEGWNSVTIKDLLTMSSGIQWNEDIRPEYDNPVYKMYLAKDVYKYIFSFKINKNKKFNYCSGNAALLSGLIYKATGMRAADYAKKFLFEPLGIHNYKWDTGPHLRDNTPGGLYLQAGDLLKIGRLYLQKGKWENKEIITGEWVKDSFFPSCSAAGYLDVNSYGYLWWINTNFRVKGKKPVNIYSANGYNNNHIIIIPEAKIVIAITGNTNLYADRYWILVKDVLERVL